MFCGLCSNSFFPLLDRVKLKPFKRVPGLIAFGVVLMVCALRWENPVWLEKVEDMTFDARVRASLHFPSLAASNLAFVYINEQSVRKVWDGSLGYRFGLNWPRQVYARLLDELTAQNARAVALDILFGELRPDHNPVIVADGSLPDSDKFFAAHLRLAGNVILAITPEITPPALFETNPWALGDIATDKDPDGILRRAKAFRLYRRWHPAFLQVAADPDFGVDLRQGHVEPRRIILPRRG